VLFAQAQATSFSGPLPPPDILQGYNDVVPGAAERILKLAEGQTAHRQDLEKRVIKSDIIKSYLGLGAAFILALAMIVGGCLVAYHGATTGHAVAGGVIATGAVAALVWAFLEGTRARREERAERAKTMTAPVARR
jgi:uncharacterized membrane protein